MPLIRRQRQQAVKIPSAKPIREVSPSDADYDIPEGVQGLPLCDDTIAVSSTHDLKLLADYDEIDDTAEYDQCNGSDSGYHMLDATNMSPTFPASPLAAFTNADKAKTWVPSSSDIYEIPMDAVMSTTLPAGSYGDNYETPVDSAM